MQNVHLRINDESTGKPTPVRLRITDATGKYYPPLGRLSAFATGVNEDVGGNVLLANEPWCYIDGACEVELPAGRIIVEACKGFEYRPLRQEVELKPGQLSIRLTLARWHNVHADGWFAADMRAHFLQPHAALLEGAGEDLAMVNVLALDWQRADSANRSLPELLAFSGQRNALEMPGHVVAVNTYNTSPLGNLSLLHCHRVVYPLHVDSINWTLADWCEQCHRKGGLVIWPEAVTSQDSATGTPSEALADLILGKIDALETTNLSWCKTGDHNYYDLLNCGVQAALVGASGKNSNTCVLGAVRTYALIPPTESWSNMAWIEAVRAGPSFVSDGPLLSFSISCPNQHAAVDHVRVQAQARAITSVARLQIVRNGEVVTEADGGSTIDVELPAAAGDWWAARCWGSSPATNAHTSPFFLAAGDRRVQRNDLAVQRVHERLQRLERHLQALAAAGRFASDKDERRARAVLDAALAKLKS